ncbi:MAG: hypothetical protein M0Z33_08125, partial [Actinomycetota bacterium]|nr:hypothetical protein [Actinomycetota bacterium]
MTARDDRVAGRGRLEALERLVRSGALPVAVLVEPPRGTGERLPAPAGLGDTVFVGGSPASVEVRYGLPGGRGASARVVTSLPGPGGSRRPPIRALVERLAREL